MLNERIFQQNFCKKRSFFNEQTILLTERSQGKNYLIEGSFNSENELIKIYTDRLKKKDKMGR